VKNKNKNKVLLCIPFWFLEKNNSPKSEKFEKVLPYFDSDFSLVINFLQQIYLYCLGGFQGTCYHLLLSRLLGCSIVAK
jgi:hypothetical protein